MANDDRVQLVEIERMIFPFIRILILLLNAVYAMLRVFRYV
jgi:hypothetical protein